MSHVTIFVYFFLFDDTCTYNKLALARENDVLVLECIFTKKCPFLYFNFR